MSQFALNADALRGIGFMLLGCTIFPILNACAKTLGNEYPITEVVWARYAGHLLIILIMFMPRRGLNLFVARRPGMQAIRSVLLFCSTSLYFTALHFLPMATAASISFTSPFIVMALSVPLLGEKVGPHRIAAALIGFAGALIIIRPGLEGTHWATFLVVGSASCFALYSVLTRKVSGIDSSDTMVAYTALVGVVVASLAMPFIDWEWPHSWFDVVLFAAMGACGGIGHFFVIKAFSFGQASMIAPFNYVQLVGATILGYWIFGNFPDRWTWIGAALIVCGGIYMAYREGVRRQAT